MSHCIRVRVTVRDALDNAPPLPRVRAPSARSPRLQRRRRRLQTGFLLAHWLTTQIHTVAFPQQKGLEPLIKQITGVDQPPEISPEHTIVNTLVNMINSQISTNGFAPGSVQRVDDCLAAIKPRLKHNNTGIALRAFNVSPVAPDSHSDCMPY